MLQRTLSPYILAFCSLSLLTSACVIDTTSLDDVKCDREGEQLDGRRCQGGLWIQSDDPSSSLDMRPLDMMDMSVPDLARPDMITVPDLDTPDLVVSADMPDMPTADLQDMPDMSVCTVNEDEVCDQTCGTSVAAMNSCGDPVTVSCPATCDAGTCISNECQPCPSSPEEFCSYLYKKNQPEQPCGEWSTSPLEGCPFAPGRTLECQCIEQQSDAMTCEKPQGSMQGICVMCVPTSDEDLISMLPAQSCGELQIKDNGCGQSVELPARVQCEAYETCEPSSQMFEGQIVQKCKRIQTDTLTQPPLSGGAQFGHSLDIHNDLLIVGAPENETGNINSEGCGSAHVYRYDQASRSWDLEANLFNDDPGQCNSGDERFGEAVAIIEGTPTGDIAVVGAPSDGSAGRVTIFRRPTNGSWNKVVTLDGSSSVVGAVAGAKYGSSLDITFEPAPPQGGTVHIAVGARNDGTAVDEQEGRTYVHRLSASSASDAILSISKLQSSSNQYEANYGESVCFESKVSANVKLFVGEPDFTESGNNEIGALFESDGFFGGSRTLLRELGVGANGQGTHEFGIAIASSSPWLAVGAGRYDHSGKSQAGAVALRHNQDTSLNTLITLPVGLVSADDRFGRAVDIKGSWLLAGAPREDGATGMESNTGAVYLFKQNATMTWGYKGLWRATSQDSGDTTGSSVALHQDWALFGAPGSGKGRVYIFPLSSP